jgi:hypothetical protein
LWKNITKTFHNLYSRSVPRCLSEEVALSARLQNRA